MVTIADNVSTDQNVQQLMNVVDRIFTERFYDIKFGIEVHTLVFNYCISRSAQDTENALFVKTSGRRKYLLGITLCMLIWRELLWKRLNDKLTIACSNLIKTWRSKPIDEIQLIADVIHSYKLGDSKTKLIDPVVDYYNELLKQTFVRLDSA
ncbi:hypothetical protein I4U23_003966 [Adineta vaga]|nr:hypothetical protein I4U23_003966 [Adineta vaga]